jgi:hypothetical protein
MGQGRGLDESALKQEGESMDGDLGALGLRCLCGFLHTGLEVRGAMLPVQNHAVLLAAWIRLGNR